MAMAINRILAVRNDRFGEFLLNIPALRALKESYASSELFLVVDPYVEELAKCIDFVDEVIIWPNKKRTFSEILKFSKELKDKKFDACVILNPSKEFNIISFLAGIPIRVGYARKLGFLLTHKMEDKKYLGTKHEVEYNLELVRLIGAETQDKGLTLKVDEHIINELLGNFNLQGFTGLVAIHPWTSDPVKQWAVSNFRELAKRIIKELNRKVVIIGGKEELNNSIELFHNFDNNLVNITGKTTLKQLAAFLKKCKLLISCDSGPVHLACCVGTPVIAIFRNDIPQKGSTRWGPYCKDSVVIDGVLSDITVDEVLDRVKEKLNK